jgi:hypothetical protein
MTLEEEIADRLTKTGYPVDAKGLGKIIAAYILGERERCADLVQKFPIRWAAPSERGVAMSLCGVLANEIRKR